MKNSKWFWKKSPVIFSSATDKWNVEGTLVRADGTALPLVEILVYRTFESYNAAIEFVVTPDEKVFG